MAAIASKAAGVMAMRIMRPIWERPVTRRQQFMTAKPARSRQSDEPLGG
jgi:hypothetical protein